MACLAGMHSVAADEGEAWIGGLTTAVEVVHRTVEINRGDAELGGQGAHFSGVAGERGAATGEGDLFEPRGFVEGRGLHEDHTRVRGAQPVNNFPHGRLERRETGGARGLDLGTVFFRRVKMASHVVHPEHHGYDGGPGGNHVPVEPPERSLGGVARQTAVKHLDGVIGTAGEMKQLDLAMVGAGLGDAVAKDHPAVAGREGGLRAGGQGTHPEEQG